MFSLRRMVWLVVLVGALVACGGAGDGTPAGETGGDGPAATAVAETDLAVLNLPPLSAVSLDGRKLQVVATTSIIGDVVQQVGGEAIDLTVLMSAGQDPHSYQPAAGDLTRVATADVVFVNGWDLEESLVDDLRNVAEGVSLVPVSAGIVPLALGEGAEHDEAEHDEAEHDEAEHDEAEHEHGGADPHTWMDPGNVQLWAMNVATALSALDPANAAVYQANAAAYQAQLADLQDEMAKQLAAIPPAGRVLVTNHDALGYLAQRYDLQVLGTVLPAASTLAEPSASELANLVAAMQEAGVCTIFAETTVNDTLAQAVARELAGCDQVQVLTLYTGAIGPAGSGADSYLGMMRANLAALVAGLQG